MGLCQFCADVPEPGRKLCTRHRQLKNMYQRRAKQKQIDKLRLNKA